VIAGKRHDLRHDIGIGCSEIVSVTI